MRILILGMENGFPQLMHHSPDQTFVFWAHVLGGGLALMLMPLQFWTKLRTARPQFHRWTGRVYVASVAVAGVAGVVLAPLAATGSIAATGFFFLATFWLGATVLAFRFAWIGRIHDHRRWMKRPAAPDIFRCHAENPIAACSGIRNTV